MQKNKNICYMISGILGYYICSNILVLYLPRAFCAVLDLLSVLVVIYSYLKVPKRKMDVDVDTKIVFSFFFIWGIGIALRGVFSFNSIFELKECISNSEAFLTYLLPFLFFLRIDGAYFYYLKKIGFICLFIGLLFFFLNINDLFLHAQEFYAQLIVADADDKYLLLGRSGIQAALLYPLFLFYIGGCIKRKEVVFFIFCFILSIISLAYAGRRGGLFSVFLYLFSPYLLHMKFKKLLLLIILLFIVYLYGINSITDRFALLSDRLFDDTRSWAEKEFYKGMDNIDWLVGKGSTGTYYSPYFRSFRNLIETGYLHLALKGGIFYSIAWCYILIMSFIKGFFSKSIMVKVMSIYILPFIPGLYLFGHPVWDLSYFVLWLCIICCNSPKIRKCKTN